MSGNTNDTVFIQKLFTSRENFTTGNVQEATANALAFVGQSGRIWWEPTTNSFYYSDGNTPGGFPIGGGGGGNGVPAGPNNSIQFNAGSGTFGGTSNVTISGNGVAVVGNVSAAYFLGSGNNLSNIRGSNVTGVVANATYAATAGITSVANSVAGANVTGAVANATYAATAGIASVANSVAGANVIGNIANANYASFAGIVTANAQPNITSVGILSGLAVSGNVSANRATANYFYGDGSNLSNINVTVAAAGNTTELQFNTAGNFNASGNLRFDTSSNTLYTDQIGIPTGGLISGNAATPYVITTLNLNQIVAFSDGSNAPLPAGSYGNPNQVPAPWAVFQFTTTPSPELEVNDVLSGSGVPVPSSVVFVGTGGNSDIVVTSSTFFGLPSVPGFNTLIPVARETLNAGLEITTTSNTDIVMTPGPGGGIIWAGNLVPLSDDTFTLGSPSRRIKQAYFGSNTIYIYDSYLGIDQTIGANNGNLIVGGGTGLTVGNFILSGNTIYLDNSTEDFNIGTIGATGNLTVNRRFNVNNSTGQWKLFDINPTGTATLISNVVTGSNIAALEIIGATTRDIQNPNNAGVLLHTSGTSQAPSRIYNDSYGNVGNGRYSAYIGRRARGNALAPTGTLNNDIISRIGANPADSSNNFAPISTTRIDFVNSEDQTPTNRGGRIEIWNTPVGGNVIALSTKLDSSGVTLVGNTATTGIRFADNTFQNTAFTDTSAVTSVTVGVGLSQTSTVGDVGIDATGVTSVAGTANQVYVNGNISGGNSNAAITLSLPQNIDAGATLSFANLTITGTLTAANFVTAGNSTVHDKILNLAYDSNSNAEIDGGGIILGNISSSYEVSILYNLANGGYWTTGNTNLVTNNVTANTANLDFLNVQNGGHFGVINESLDYPNAYVQIDSNINSYSQIISQNHSPGTKSSSDLVLVNDIGDDTSHYLDLGINGSNYTDPLFSSTTGNDGYLFVNQGNLVIGTDTPGETVKFVAGGTTSNDIIVTISNTGIATPGNVSANYFIGNGSQLTGIAAGNITGQVANALVAGTVYTNAQPNITSVGTLTSLTVSGNITSGNANLGNLATANYFSGNGYYLTNINVSNITGTIANANYAAYAGNVVNSLTVNNSGTGAASGVTFNGGTAVTISYNTVGAPKADGTGASGTWGISITGNSNVANTAIAVAGANVSGTVASATVATTANAVAGANVSGQVSYAAIANLVAGANVSGAVSFATTANAVAGANVSGTVASATVAASANAVAGANVSGQVNYAAVANFVVGANVSGAVSFATTANAVAGANVSGQVSNALISGTVYTNAQPNITSVGTLTGFTSNGVVNFANTSNVALGAVANLHITGGSANNILLTNGSGNLSWASISTVNGVGGNQLVFVLNAQQSIGNAKNTLLSLFGLTNGVALATNTRYQYEILFNAQCSKAGTLSYALALGGGAAVAQHNYIVTSNKTTTIDTPAAGVTMMSQNATGAAITTAQTVADTATFTHTTIQGTIDVTTGGNVNFMVSQDQNTPVTWTINAGSYVRLMPLGAIGANTAAGTWS